jgi:ubiquinone/menaquinone biosynthesis C-methylase UbiE
MLNVDGTADQLLPGITAGEYLRHMRKFPRFWPTLDASAGVADRPAVPAPANEFDTDSTGRGDSYRVAQRHCEVRRTGIVGLVERALDGPLPTGPAPGLRVLDVLGGDGTVARAVAELTGSAADPWILTGDVSRHMTAEAVRYGIPAVCQPAQQLALHSGTFDAVILAYGTHHIAPAERKDAYAEAWRVLKPGGRIVVHDFDQQGQVARWFDEVVDRYAPGGHRYEHFTEAELRSDLASVGFTAVRTEDLYDPFIMAADSRAAAVQALSSYAFHMYGLFGLREEHPDGWVEPLWRLMARHLTYPRDSVASVTSASVRQRGARFVAVAPRVALVGVGTKRS